MKTITSVSGGKTSAYLAANYPADHNLFALVCIDDKKCTPKDKKAIQYANDKLDKGGYIEKHGEFIATTEDDTILYTMMDLEQHIGAEITWVRGISFDEVVEKKGGWLPNKLHRYCTVWLKLAPMFYWWADIIGKPVIMNIGYRANEQKRAKRMLEKTNTNGLLEMKATFGKHTEGHLKGLNKWEMVGWQKPQFLLIEDRVYKDGIEKYWKDKDVRFALLNNCVGCFHRNPILLKKMYEAHENKMDWFASQEGGDNGYWRSDISYEKIKQHDLQIEIDFEDFSDCDSGYCGL